MSASVFVLFIVSFLKGEFTSPLGGERKKYYYVKKRELSL